LGRVTLLIPAFLPSYIPENLQSRITQVSWGRMIMTPFTTFDGVMMDVSEHGEEIYIIFYRLAFIASLEEVAASRVFCVEST